MTWIGRKKLAFVPLVRTNAHPPDNAPADWENQILRRALFDPDPQSGRDRSLRAFINAASSGRADFDAIVQPRQTVDGQDVPVDALESQFGETLRAQGFQAAALVMLGGIGAGTAQRGGFWARFVMQEAVGVWAMEVMHCLTGFDDLYPFGGDMGAFDEMGGSSGSHPSAYTKAAIGWINSSTIVGPTSHDADFTLHAVGLFQPPPSGRVAAIRIGSTVPYLMIEARLKVDAFDAGIPSEGVIVYQVKTTDPLGHALNETPPVSLLTPAALAPGQSYTSSEGIKISVTGGVAGGFKVHVKKPTDARCPNILAQIAEIDDDIRTETDINLRKQLLMRRGQLRFQAQQLGCT